MLVGLFKHCEGSNTQHADEAGPIGMCGTDGMWDIGYVQCGNVCTVPIDLWVAVP